MEKKRTEYHTEDHKPKKKTKTHSRDRLHLKLQSVAEKAKTIYPTVQNLPESPPRPRVFYFGLILILIFEF